jgi:hypothetical protein
MPSSDETHHAKSAEFRAIKHKLKNEELPTPEQYRDFIRRCDGRELEKIKK